MVPAVASDCLPFCVGKRYLQPSSPLHLLMADVEAVLAEFRRENRAHAGGAGRRLGADAKSRGPSASTANDTDAALRWMESRVDALAAEVAATDRPLPSARRRSCDDILPTPRVRTDASRENGRLSELAQLEARSREQSSKLRSERARVAAMRERLRREGVDDSAVGPAQYAEQLPPPPPRSAVVVRPAKAIGTGRGSGGGGGRTTTSACELAEAASRRAHVLRRQLPLIRAELDATEAERVELDALLRLKGLAVSDADIAKVGGDQDQTGGDGGGAGGGGQSAGRRSTTESGMPADSATLLVQLRHLDRASRAAFKGTSGGRGGGVHTLGSADPPLVPVTVFADGFMLYRGPFRSFGVDSNDHFARQVMAGFLPLELQERYTDGCGLEVHDSTGVTHAHAQAAAIEQHSARGRPNDGCRSSIAGLADVRDGAAALLAPQPAEQLLRAMPLSVVRDGNVLPVRSEIATLIGAGAGAATEVQVAIPASPVAAQSIPSYQPQGQAGSARGVSGGTADAEQQFDGMESWRAARLRRFGGA
jgi:hypothetical protein